MIYFSLKLDNMNQTKISPYVYAGLIKSTNLKLNNEQIIEAVAEHFGISVADILGQVRKREFVIARSWCIHMMINFTNTMMIRVADVYMKRDHSSIIHLRDKFKSDLDIYADVRQAYKKFLEGVNYNWSCTL